MSKIYEKTHLAFMAAMRDCDCSGDKCSDLAWFLRLEAGAMQWKRSHPEETRDATDLVHFYLGEEYPEGGDE